jgi:hypothetical protein
LAQESPKPSPEVAKIDPDLARVNDAWRALPEAIRRAILAMIETY